MDQGRFQGRQVQLIVQLTDNGPGVIDAWAFRELRAMQKLFAILVDGTIYFSWLFIVSIGLTLIYGVMKILNIAHGSFYALGAYTAASAVGAYFAGNYPAAGSFLLLVAAGVAVGAIVGFLVERGLLRPMYGRDEIVLVLVTYAAFLVFEDVIKLVWGVDPYFAYQPYALLGRISIGGIGFAVYDLAPAGPGDRHRDRRLVGAQPDPARQAPSGRDP